jgi:hypothetical protein
MRRLVVPILAAVLSVACSLTALTGQERPRTDYEPILEVGVAAERDLTERVSYVGGTIAVEVTAVEHLLELELGVSAARASGQTELGVDLLFKKPYRLSSSVEFMFGLGPTVARDLEGPQAGTFLGASVVLDFMFWPGRGRVGWYVEPSYGVTSHAGTGPSLSLVGGLLVRLH